MYIEMLLCIFAISWKFLHKSFWMDVFCIALYDNILLYMQLHVKETDHRFIVAESSVRITES